MINSMCGSVGGGSVKKENSCSKLQQPTSPTASVSESNNIIALPPPASNDFNHPNPSSLNFEGLKFEVDVDEIQSPDSSIWESLFADHIDTSTDFMISSPKMTTPDFMIMSPKRNTSLSQHISTYNQNYNYMHGQTLLGSSPPSSISTHVGAYTTIQKGKAQSPLHKVFTSTGATANDDEGKSSQDNNNNLALDRFLDDGFIGGGMTGGGGGGYPMKMEGNFSESFEMPTTLSAMLGYSPLGNSSSQQSSAARYDGGLVNDVGSMQMPQEYQINTFATQQQQQQQQQHNPDHGLIGAGSDQDQQDSGLQLVHLLLACAEAVAKEDYMTARRYLHHLNRVVTPLGDSMQRVASCFTDALSARLAATLTTSPNTSTPKQPFTPFPSNSLEILKIYQIVYQACPYIKFAHFTANQAIFEAFETEERVHIIDLDIHQGYQWPAFMQALAARPGGAPFLRITGVGSPPESVRETGRCLTELAHSLHIPFEFHPVGERLEDLKSHMFHRRVGEALAVNSVNRLHRVSGNHLGNLLGIIRDQAPNIVTLVEQEASHNGPYFLGRFLEALHYYSAIFDSLDATFPMDSAERAKVEHYIFAPEIRNIVANEGPDRVERHERLEKWRKMMEGRGFKGVPLSANAVTQSKILLGLYSCDGYRLTEDRGCLLLGWQDRALIAASAWRC